MGTPIWSTLDRRGEYDRPEIVGADQLQWGGGMGGMGASIGSPLPQTRRGRVFEISVGRGEQSKILKVAVLKKNRFPKQTFSSKHLICGRRRPSAHLKAREHRRVRFFGARSGLATQGSNFYGHDSRPRQRVRNFRRAWQATENLEKYLARKFRKLPCSENRFPRQTFRSKN